MTLSEMSVWHQQMLDTLCQRLHGLHCEEPRRLLARGRICHPILDSGQHVLIPVCAACWPYMQAVAI